MFNLTRDSYLAADVRGTAPCVPEGSDVAVWGWETAGKVYGVAFAGKSAKPVWNYRFANRERRQEEVDKLVASRQSHHARVAKRAAERRSYEHTLKVGDILRSSWGYDQTNIDFYEVVAVKSKSAVIRPIASRQVRATGWETEEVTAAPGQFTGAPRTVRVTEGNAVKVRSFAHAFPWDGQPECASHYA